MESSLVSDERGYVFQHTRNIIAPWIAHTLAIAALLATGAMVLVQYTSE